jgi:hypothetical protein
MLLDKENKHNQYKKKHLSKINIRVILCKYCVLRKFNMSRYLLGSCPISCKTKTSELYEQSSLYKIVMFFLAT